MAKLIRLTKADMRTLFRRYDIGGYLSHRHIPWALGNSVYLLRTTSGRYILKIHQGMSIDSLMYVLKVMEFARTNGIPIAETMRTRSGRFVSLQGGKTITLQRFVEGEKGGWISNRERLVNTSRVVGQVSRAMRKLPLHGDGRHIAFKFEKASWGPKSVNGFDLAGEQAKLHGALKLMRRGRLRKNMVHADIHSGNLLYEGNRVAAVLDWDDIHKDLLVYEPAIFISANFISSKMVMWRKIRVFLAEYQGYVRLNAEERGALYYLIKHRMLGSLVYLCRQRETRDSAELRHNIKKIIARYNRFNGVSPAKFNNLFGNPD